MKIKPLVLFLVVGFLLLNSNANAASKNINPGIYEDWGRRINKLEIIQSFKITDYSQLVIREIDMSNIQYQLDGFSEDTKSSLTKEGQRIFIDKIKNNPKHLEIIETNGGNFNKTLILKISILKIGAEKGSALVASPGMGRNTRRVNCPSKQ